MQHGGLRTAMRGTQWATSGGKTAELAESVLSLEFAAGERFGVATPGGGAYEP